MLRAENDGEYCVVFGFVAQLKAFHFIYLKKKCWFCLKINRHNLRSSIILFSANISYVKCLRRWIDRLPWNHSTPKHWKTITCRITVAKIIAMKDFIVKWTMIIQLTAAYIFDNCSGCLFTFDTIANPYFDFFSLSFF